VATPGTLVGAPKGPEPATVGGTFVDSAGTIDVGNSSKKPGDATRKKESENQVKAKRLSKETTERKQKSQAQADSSLESDASFPPYPRHRDDRIKKPIAKQSGPVTEEGKQAVSQNAIKHGGYAIPTKGDESFASIERSIIGRLEPMGQEQHSLAKSISYEIWRIGNIERAVVELERDIDLEKVSLGQLAVQVDFPFPDCYRDTLITYKSEETLRQRVHGYLSDEFKETLEKATRNPEETGAHKAGPNARALRLINKGCEILSRQHLLQELEEDFFEEFDAVMLDARLGRNSLHPSVGQERHAGWSLPLVECWVYRNFRQIRITQNRLKVSLRIDLMTSPSIERALRSATARLGLLLSDYRDCRPDINEQRLHMLGYGPSRR
jgi:hypothetical protein